MLNKNEWNNLIENFFNSDPVYYSSTYRLVPVEKKSEYVKDEFLGTLKEISTIFFFE